MDKGLGKKRLNEVGAAVIAHYSYPAKMITHQDRKPQQTQTKSDGTQPD